MCFQRLINRFKFLMLTTVVCAAMTVVLFILSQVYLICVVSGSDLQIQVPDVDDAGLCCYDGSFLYSKSIK